MQCYEDECCCGCYFDCSCCLKPWKEFNVLGWWCRCICDKQKDSEDAPCDQSLLSSGHKNSSLNPMRMDSRWDWKATQTEADTLLSEEKSKYDGSRNDIEYEEFLLRKADLNDERKRFEEERRQMLIDLEAAEEEKKTAAKSLRDIQSAEIAVQRADLEAERRKFEKERDQILLDMRAAESDRVAAEQAAQAAEEKRKEAAAGLLLQKAMSRQNVSTALHKQEEAEAQLVAAEEQRRAAEEGQRRYKEEAAAMAAVQQELAESLQEQQVEFVKNMASLTPSGLECCRRLVPILLRNPNMAICIDSHTNCFLDKCKDHCIHMNLSQQRVDAVKEQLKRGGAHNNIITKGWGCKHPEIKNQRAVHIYPAPKSHPGMREMVSL